MQINFSYYLVKRFYLCVDNLTKFEMQLSIKGEPMILALTDVNNTPVYINSEHIIRFNRVDNQTSIRLSDGQWFSVKEDPDYICAKVNDWGK